MPDAEQVGRREQSVTPSVRASGAFAALTFSPMARSAGSMMRARSSVHAVDAAYQLYVALDGERDVVAAEAEAVAEHGASRRA